jgi:hypothetical protein
MKRICAVAAFAVLLFAAVCGPSAQAKDMRFPEKSPVAFRLHLPKDWTATDDGSGHLTVAAPDHSSVLLLSMIDDAGAAKEAPEAIAEEIFKAQGADPISTKEPVTISGADGTAFYSHHKNDKGVNMNLKLDIFEIGGQHVGMLMVLSASDINAAQKNSVDAVIKGITLTGVK